MGQLVLTKLVSEVQAGLLHRNDLDDYRCVDALNFAQNRISRSHDFLELKGFHQTRCQFTTDPFNDKFLPVAPYTKHIHTVVLATGDTTSRKLVGKPWRIFDKNWPAPEVLARSKPYFYSRWNNNLVLYPVPDFTWKVIMRITTFPRPFDLAQQPQAVSDYEWKDDMLVLLACAYLWKSYGRYDKANDYFREAQEHFVAAVKQDTDAPDLDINLDLADQGFVGQYWQDPFVKVAP